MLEVHLHVAGAAADADESAALTSRLRDELLDRDVDSVTRPTGSAPGGAKGDGLALAQLAVGFSGSLPALVGMIASWRARQRGAMVTIECAGDRLTLSDATAAEQSALVQAWLARHDIG